MPDGVEKVVHLEDPVFEQVAEALWALPEELQSRLSLHHLGEEQDADLGLFLADLEGGACPFIRLRGGIRTSTIATSGRSRATACRSA